MARPQANANGRMPMRNGRPSAGVLADVCCCEAEEAIFWWSLWPCSAAFPVDGAECYPGETDDADCIWITQAQKDAIHAAAAAAGDYDPMGDPGVWPDHLVVTWGGVCWLIDGPSIEACDWNCNAVAPPDDPPGTHATTAEYLGLSCAHAACDADGDTDPDPPPGDPDGPAPDPTEDLCGCTGKTAGTVTFAGITPCDCGDWVTFDMKTSAAFDGTWDIQPGCTLAGGRPYITRQYDSSDGSCSGDLVGTSGSVATPVLLATGGTGWRVRYGLGTAFLQGIFHHAGPEGDCDGATINNTMAGCNNFGVLATGGTAVVTLTP
jgi:hypothetical protein